MIVAQVEAADIAPIDQQLSALELVETGNQFADARLARAGMPDERDGLARREWSG